MLVRGLTSKDYLSSAFVLCLAVTALRGICEGDLMPMTRRTYAAVKLAEVLNVELMNTFSEG